VITRDGSHAASEAFDLKSELDLKFERGFLWLLIIAGAVSPLIVILWPLALICWLCGCGRQGK